MIDELKHKWNVECVVWCKFDKLYDGCQHLLKTLNVEVNSFDDEHEVLRKLIEYLDSEDCVYEKEWMADQQVLDMEITCLTQFEKNIAYYYEKGIVRAMSGFGGQISLREHFRKHGVGTSVDRSWEGYYTKKRRRFKEYDKAEQERRYEKYLYANSGIELETT